MVRSAPVGPRRGRTFGLRPQGTPVLVSARWRALDFVRSFVREGWAEGGVRLGTLPMGVMMEALYHTSLSVVGEVKPKSLTRPCLLRKRLYDSLKRGYTSIRRTEMVARDQSKPFKTSS